MLTDYPAYRVDHGLMQFYQLVCLMLDAKLALFPNC
jgi:hypothetical protein